MFLLSWIKLALSRELKEEAPVWRHYPCFVIWRLTTYSALLGATLPPVRARIIMGPASIQSKWDSLGSCVHHCNKPRCRWWYFWKLKLYLLLKSERDIEETWREILTGFWIGAGLQCGDCLLVFLQGGHSNYWRQTRRTIYCFPRCHWTTSPFYSPSSVSGWHNLRGFLATWFDPESFPHSAYVMIFATFATKGAVCWHFATKSDIFQCFVTKSEKF